MPRDIDGLIDDIDRLVDEQLAAGPVDDYNTNRYDRCPHCARDWHGIVITERVEQMRWLGRFDDDYRMTDDNSRVICPGSEFIGPVQAREAVVDKHLGSRQTARARPIIRIRGSFVGHFAEYVAVSIPLVAELDYWSNTWALTLRVVGEIRETHWILPELNCIANLNASVVVEVAASLADDFQTLGYVEPETVRVESETTFADWGRPLISSATIAFKVIEPDEAALTLIMPSASMSQRLPMVDHRPVWLRRIEAQLIATEGGNFPDDPFDSSDWFNIGYVAREIT